MVYHVQTEDKGLNSPLILSLVYSGGEILASKRVPYGDLIAAGFNEEDLAQRLKRQHRLICAAIKAGRLDELKRMGVRADVPLVGPASQTEISSAIIAEPVDEVKVEAALPVEGMVANETAGDATVEIPQDESLRAEVAKRSKQTSSDQDSAYTVYDPRRQSPLGEVEVPKEGLAVTLMGEQDLNAGDAVTLRILVEKRTATTQKPISGVSLSVKILGTTFRPQIHSVRTGRDGIGVVAAQIPSFTSGRAALLIRAVIEDQSTEVRRVIYPATEVG